MADTQRQREKILAMFRIIDASHWPMLSSFYTHDCVYLRPGYEPIKGIAALERFYETERKIEQGNHELEHIVIEEGQAVAIGVFTGVLRDGTAASVAFADTYEFVGDRIASRRTFFDQPAV